MRYPEFLRPNGNIGFIAPAFGCSFEPYKSAFESALNTFTSMGYRTVLGPNCYADSGIGISNTPIACGKELTDYYLSEDNDILLTCGGGELMCETIDYVDFGAIAAARPKWYMGYSDNTNFTFLSATLCDTAAIYGPSAGAFGMSTWHRSIEDAFNLITGKSLSFLSYPFWEKESLKTPEAPLVPYNATEPSVIKRFPDEDFIMSGRLLGGCLDCLCTLTGTRYDKVADFTDRYSNDGILWFIESCDLNVMDMRRKMWQLDRAGWFKNCSGFIIGRPMHYNEPAFGMDQYKAVVDIISKYNVPILMDADIGHLPPSIPIICGALGTVTTSGNEYRIEMSLE